MVVELVVRGVLAVIFFDNSSVYGTQGGPLVRNSKDLTILLHTHGCEAGSKIGTGGYYLRQ